MPSPPSLTLADSCRLELSGHRQRVGRILQSAIGLDVYTCVRACVRAYVRSRVRANVHTGSIVSQPTKNT